MARMLPVGEATELPIETPDTSRLDKGLRGPQTPPADLGSRGPQYNRTSFQGPQQPASMRSPTPVADALAAEARAPTGPAAQAVAPSRTVRAATAAGRVAGQGLRAAGGLAAPVLAADAVSHFNDYKIDDPEVDSSAAGTFRALRNGDLSMAGRSISKGALEAGMDLGSAVANAADYVVPGKAPVSTRYNQFLRNQFGDQLIDKSGTRTVAPATSNTSSDQYPEPQSIRNAMSSGPAPTTPSAQPVQGDASAPFPIVPGGPSAPEVAAIEQRANDIRGSMIPIQKTLDGYGPGVHGPDGSGGMANLGGSQVERNKQFDREVLAGKIDESLRLGGRRGAAAAQAYAQQLDTMNKRDDAGSAERIATLRDRGETTRAIAANQTQRQIHADANAVTMRGQDTSLLGHRMTNDVARANSLRDQANKDREYVSGREDKLVERRNAAAKALPEEIAAMLPPGADGKPDTVNAARHAQGITNAVADLAQNHPDPAMREKLQREGLAALDQSDKRRLVAGMQLADVVNATATGGLTPWGTRAIQSNAPIMAIKKLPNGDYQTNRRGVNGETEIIPGRYIEKEGSILGIGGRPSDKFKALME